MALVVEVMLSPPCPMQRSLSCPLPAPQSKLLSTYLWQEPDLTAGLGHEGATGVTRAEEARWRISSSPSVRERPVHDPPCTDHPWCRCGLRRDGANPAPLPDPARRWPLSPSLCSWMMLAAKHGCVTPCREVSWLQITESQNNLGWKAPLEVI